MTQALFWIDVETTGLDPREDYMIELGITSTTENLTIAVHRSWVIRLSDEGLSRMNPEILTMHGRSGLLEEARKAGNGFEQVERDALRFLQGFKRGESPMCGSTIGFDRAFLKAWMPDLHDWFHYRNIDVSTVKNLARVWYPDFAKYEGRDLHRVKPDLEDSIAELGYYRDAIFATAAYPQVDVSHVIFPNPEVLGPTPYPDPDPDAMQAIADGTGELAPEDYPF